MPAPFSLRLLSTAITLLALAGFGIGATLLTGCGSGSRAIAVSAKTPTPAPSATSTPSAAPSAAPTPTPNPTPTPTATPTPVPTPTGDPSLLSYYIADNTSPDSDTRAFTATTSTMQLGGGPGNFTTTYTRQGGTIFTAGSSGKTTTATLATEQGMVTVSRQEKLSQGLVTGYLYFTQDRSGYTQYGSDTLDSETGQLSASDRFNPPVFYPYDLTAGQSRKAATQITTSGYFLGTDTVVTTNTATATFTLTFVGVESVTVPAGTFTAARVTLDFQYSGYPMATSSYGGTTTTETAADVGVVKSVTMLSGFSDSFTYSSTETDLLTGATVGGVHYGS